MGNQFALDLRTFPRELRLMLAFMGVDERPDKTDLPEGALSDIDWDQFLLLAAHHRVYPQVYFNLKKADQSSIPPVVLKTLNRDYNRNTYQMLHLTGEMERLCKIMDENRIRSLALKGPVLAKDLYGDLSLRTSKDLDLLIPFQEMERAERIMHDLGYILARDIPRSFNDWKWKTNHLSFYHPDKRIQVEIHWKLNSGIGKEPGFEELWSRSRISSISNCPVRLLGKEDLFLYLVSHGARHAWFRLRWLADIDLLVRKRLDWGKLIPLLKSYNGQHIGGQALLLASTLLKTPLTPEMQPLISTKQAHRFSQEVIVYIKDMVQLCPDPETKALAKAYRRYLFSLMTNPEKWQYIIKRMYPSSRDTRTLPLPRYLYFLYLPLRPFLVLWRRKMRSPEEDA